MPNHKIVAVGGTGQRLLSLYCRLFLVGIVDEPFHAVIVDSDETYDDILIFKRFFDLVRLFAEEGKDIGGSLVPSISEIAFAAGEAVDNTAESLTGTPADRLSMDHPARAFFSSDLLAQPIRGGLYARPALVALRDLGELQQSPALAPETDSVMVTVSSIIGGTGAGLTGPCINACDRLTRRRNLQQPKPRGVFFARYFYPDEDKGSLADRFPSSEIFSLKALEEAVGGYIDQYTIIGGPGAVRNLPDRDYSKEKAGRAVDWPDGGHPMWEALESLHHRLRDTVAARGGTFTAREAPIPGEEGTHHSLNREQTLQRTREAVLRCSTLIKKNAIQNLGEDWLANWTWGHRLLTLVGSFFNQAKQSEVSINPEDFSRSLQRRMEDLWFGADKPGLMDYFAPYRKKRRVAVHEIRRVPWPDCPKSLPRMAVEEILDRAAATLLYSCLRRVPQ